MEGHSHQNMEGPPIIEEGICVDLGNRRERDISSKMMETMHSLKENLESIKADNENLLKVKVEQ